MQKYEGQWIRDKKTGSGILYQNLNNEMKEFIEKEMKKDFFIISPIKNKSAKNIKSETISNLDKQKNDNKYVSKSEHKSEPEPEPEHKSEPEPEHKSEPEPELKPNIKEESGYVNIITNFFKKYI